MSFLNEEKEGSTKHKLNLEILPKSSTIGLFKIPYRNDYLLIFFIAHFSP